MKKFKQSLSLCMAAVLVLSVCTVAFHAFAFNEEPLHNEKDYYDFSEYNLASSFSEDSPYGGNNNALLEGGYASMSTAYFARWDGPVNEVSDPYPTDFSDIENMKYTDYPYVLPIKNVFNYSNNLSDLKAALMKHGALYVSFSFNDNSSDPNYYTGVMDYLNAPYGHAVTMVGWDDNYPRENFNVKPPRDGAIICKNSWGPYSGDDGYIYISYCDAIFNIEASNFSSFIGYDSAPDYNKIYQYDECGMTSDCFKSYDEIEYIANVFPEEGKSLSNDEILKAVSFYSSTGGTEYEAYLISDFKEKSDIDINSPKAKLISSGELEYAGYHVIDLEEEIKLAKGTRFAIVIKYNAGYFDTVSYPIEIPSWYSKYARGNKGESFYKTPGMVIDLYDDSENANWCIKAFTGEASDNKNGSYSSNGFIKNAIFGIDNKNRKYTSDKVYTVDELIEKGFNFSEKFIEYTKNPHKNSNGLIPSPVEFKSPQTVFSKKFPEKYDLRDHGYVTTVKDQGRLGTCWAFASIASLESNLIVQNDKDGIFDNVTVLNMNDENKCPISSKGSEAVFKFTADKDGIYTFSLSGGAFKTEVCSAFGIVYDTYRVSDFSVNLVKNETIYFRVKFVDESKTGEISVDIGFKSKYKVINVNLNDTYSETLPAGESVILRYENNGYNDFSAYFKLTSDDNIIFDGYSLNTYNYLYVDSQEHYEFLLTADSEKDCDFTFELVDYFTYYTSNCKDIGSATEYVSPDGTIPSSIRFTPDETGYYKMVYDLGQYVHVIDSDGFSVYSDEYNHDFNKLFAGQTYYWVTQNCNSGYFRIVKLDELDITEFNLQPDKTFANLIKYNDVKEHVFTAPENGKYLFNIVNSENTYDIPFDIISEITDKNGNPVETQKIEFYTIDSYIVELNKDETIKIIVSCDVNDEDFDEEYISNIIAAYSIEVRNITSDDGTDSITSFVENTANVIPHNSIEKLYKFTTDKAGYYGIRITNLNSEYNYLSLYPDRETSESHNISYLYSLNNERGWEIYELEANKTYYFSSELPVNYNDNYEILFRYFENETSISPDKLSFGSEVSGYTLKHDSVVDIPIEFIPDKNGKISFKVYTPYENLAAYRFKNSNGVFEFKKSYNENNDFCYYFESVDAVTTEGFYDTLSLQFDGANEFRITSEYIADYTFSFKYNDKFSLELLVEMLFDMLIEENPYVSIDYKFEVRYLGEKFTKKLNIGQELPYTEKDIVWRSTNEDVATVDENGVVTCVGLGSTRIIAQTPDGAYSCSRTVYVEYSWWQKILNAITFGQISYV